MANLKEIRRRIISVKNTQKITRAMKMVAAAKLRKAQEAAEQFRAYADLLSQVLAEVAGNASSKDHPLLDRREPKHSLVVVMSADRGLCGGFNSGLCRDSLKHIKKSEPEPVCAIVGRKAKDFFQRRPVEIDKIYSGVLDDASYATAAKIAHELAERYTQKEMDRIELVYNELISMMSQKPSVKQLLPVKLPEKKEETDTTELAPVGFIFEPGRGELLDSLLPRYVEVQVYRALLESIAAEHAARMTAMDSATKNAEEMLDQLTLVYNRARQSAITSELMDIVGGSEALSE